VIGLAHGTRFATNALSPACRDQFPLGLIATQACSDIFFEDRREQFVPEGFGNSLFLG